MAYFVTYQILVPGNPPRMSSPANVILRETHPIYWASHPPHASNRAGMATYLLWWTEITDDAEELIADAKGWCGIED